VVRLPLAVCDMRTVTPDDVINARIADKSCAALPPLPYPAGQDAHLCRLGCLAAAAPLTTASDLSCLCFRRLEIAMATHSPDHSWWYYPNMQPDEVMLILTYDSAAAPFVPTLHCAFDDPASPAATEEGAQRESIEARLLLVMPEADGETAKL